MCYDDEFESMTQDTILKERTWQRGDFLDFIVKNGSPPHQSEGKFESPMKERIKEWKPLYQDGICTMCGLCSHKCHTNIYGPLCMQAVANYREQSKGSTCGFTAARLFINYYNMTLQSDTYRKTGILDNTGWKFPPPCLKERCLDFIVQWLSWMKWHKFGHSDSPPPEFYQYAGQNVPQDLEDELKSRIY